jgi:alcohol-forming fatty acyl-CoA reductase
VIFRPAVVIPTSKEPIKGWIDNMYGPTGIVVGCAVGLLRVLYIHKENKAEIVPVDYCVNSMLACAYDASENSYDEPPIYNYVSAKDNLITWQKYCDISAEVGDEMPLMKMAWCFTFFMSSSKLLVNILTFLYHTVPAAIVDAALFLCGKKPK